MNHIVFLFYMSGTLCLHPMHISVTNVEYNEKTEVFDISFKLFHDDFQTIIQNKYGVNLNLGKENELSNSTEYICKYVNEHFKLRFNDQENQKNTLEFVKKEMNEEAVWFYYRLKPVKGLKKIKLFNSMMCDLFNDQKNMVIFTYKEIQKGFDLRYNDEDIIINIED